MSDSLLGGANQRLSRSVAKTLGYRVLMLAITITVAFAVTDDVVAALNIGVITNVVKTGTYFGYERLWARISWGATSA
ncbi:hypothetical protein L593_14180 [Salinarchaeum sp. Harcht-Bsk1]|uniref:DUF2061 domain-containing protein n=1 Tax=Salinarchaeum sp. Harcht-Bsk1 TaxID=1333523 RepID=UPI00034242BB|nr:DUF2061 domain-containing protein [Salinarchaeum sp. Harcht-Bsk1]AGN02775.1 hypothetical protein L593_14180 [Salinarchaeum sp. Harcht-Bsk1]